MPAECETFVIWAPGPWRVNRKREDTVTAKPVVVGVDSSEGSLQAVAWAGSKPLASLADGWLASNAGVRWAAVIMAVPAIAIAAIEICPETWFKKLLKSYISRFRSDPPVAEA